MTGTIKGYLINTAARTIKPVKYSGHYSHIYTLCGFDTFDLVRFDKGDGVFVDDNGLIKGPVYNFFGLRGYGQPLAGNALILGSDSEGETTSPAFPLEYYKARLVWIERLFQNTYGVTVAGKRKTQLATLETVSAYLGEPL